MATNYFSFLPSGNEFVFQPLESRLVFEIALINGMRQSDFMWRLSPSLKKPWISMIDLLEHRCHFVWNPGYPAREAIWRRFRALYLTDQVNHQTHEWGHLEISISVQISRWLLLYKWHQARAGKLSIWVSQPKRQSWINKWLLF